MLQLLSNILLLPFPRKHSAIPVWMSAELIKTTITYCLHVFCFTCHAISTLTFVSSTESTFGPSVPGHLNLISGQTHGAMPSDIQGVINGTVIGNPDPVR